jgi:hypothetical protein
MFHLSKVILVRELTAPTEAEMLKQFTLGTNVHFKMLLNCF